MVCHHWTFSNKWPVRTNNHTLLDTCNASTKVPALCWPEMTVEAPSSRWKQPFFITGNRVIYFMMSLSRLFAIKLQWQVLQVSAVFDWLGECMDQSSFAFNPFTPESDQCQNSPAASPEILHHTVRRTWHFHSLLRWKVIILQILATSLIQSLFERLGEYTFWAQEWKG